MYVKLYLLLHYLDGFIFHTKGIILFLGEGGFSSTTFTLKVVCFLQTSKQSTNVSIIRNKVIFPQADVPSGDF
jgi:hypothetical protein